HGHYDPRFSLRPRPPSSTLFPYTTLFRSRSTGELRAASSFGNPIAAAVCRVAASISLFECDSRSMVRPLISIAPASRPDSVASRSEEHTSELQSRGQLVCRLLLEKKKTTY